MPIPNVTYVSQPLQDHGRSRNKIKWEPGVIDEYNEAVYSRYNMTDSWTMNLEHQEYAAVQDL